MTREFGKGSLVTTYLSLVHDVWSFIWEDLKGGTDPDGKVWNLQKAWSFTWLVNNDGWGSADPLSFHSFCLFLKVTSNWFCRSISRSHVWWMTLAVSRNLSLGCQLEYLYVSLPCSKSSSSQLCNLVPRMNIPRGPGRSYTAFMTWLGKSHNVTSGIHSAPCLQNVGEGNTGLHLWMEQHHFHILREAWEIFVALVSENAIRQAFLLVPKGWTLRDTIYLVGCLGGAGGTETSHIKIHLCDSGPSHISSRYHQYSPHCSLCCHSFNISTHPSTLLYSEFFQKILSSSLSSSLTFIQHLLNIRHHVNFYLHNP